jgi:hypothetical protein
MVGLEVEFEGRTFEVGRLGDGACLVCGLLLTGLLMELALKGLDDAGLAAAPAPDAALIRCAFAKSGRINNATITRTKTQFLFLLIFIFPIIKSINSSSTK